MAKEIVFDTDKLAAGVDKLANAVKITMGPKGRTVVIDNRTVPRPQQKTALPWPKQYHCLIRKKTSAHA